VTYQVELTRTARRALAETLPEKVVHVVVEFMRGPLAENPHRVSKPLEEPLEGLRSARRGPYRVIFSIDEQSRVVLVRQIANRDDVYRPAP
jgi:mRNA-degrading endonuclease RelE of RelBE toxin-antitoxin system